MEGRHIEKSATQRKIDIHGGAPYTRRDVYTEGTYGWRGRTEYIAYITHHMGNPTKGSHKKMEATCT